MIRAIHTWLTARGGLRQLPRLLSLLFGVSPTIRRDLTAMSSKIGDLYLANGATFTIAYLKECVRVVQHYTAGNRVRVSEGSVMVSLSGGLPSLIPGSLRGWVRSGHTICTVCALSILGVYRGLVTPGVLKLESITGPSTAVLNTYVETFEDFSRFVPRFFAMLPREIRLGSPSLATLSTSVGPNGGRASISALKDAAVLTYCERENLTHLLRFVRHAYGSRWYWIFRLVIGLSAFFYSLASFRFPVTLRGVKPSEGIEDLIGERISWHRSLLSRVWYYLRYLFSVRPRVSFLGLTARLSRLEEAAGKIRVVAIVDFWTQMALKPLHRAIFAVLREIPNDGTFGQESCVDMLRRKVGEGLAQAQVQGSTFTAYSYDLSSATDRIPVDIYQTMLTHLFGGSFAVFWRALLTFRKWRDKYVAEWFWTPKGPKPIFDTQDLQYAVGQPMGAYSSWAMLALAHHAIVQYCAHLEGYEGWFEGYGIVGDDVVILDSRVAQHYLAVVTGWGVSISMSKSLISSIGTFEFCKRLVGPNGDLSGIPIGLIYQSVVNPMDSATLFSHVVKRGHTLFPIAIARTVAFLLRVPPRFTTPIWELQACFRIVFAMLVQPGFPLWQGIFLVQLLPSLTVEELEELVRTKASRPTQEIGLYKYLEDLAFASHLANLLPVNWKKPLVTVVPDLDRLLGRSVPESLAIWIILWMTPLGWWLMKITLRSAGRLLLYAFRAWQETRLYPVAHNFLTRYYFWISRIRARVIEDYRGNSKEYLTVVNRASGRTLYDVSFTSEVKDRRARRSMTWILRSVRKYRPGIEAPLDEYLVPKV